MNRDHDVSILTKSYTSKQAITAAHMALTYAWFDFDCHVPLNVQHAELIIRARNQGIGNICISNSQSIYGWTNTFSARILGSSSKIQH